MNDTLLKGDSTETINMKIMECKHLDSLKIIFDSNISIIDSLLETDDDDDLLSADSILNYTISLEYPFRKEKTRSLAATGHW